MIVGSTIFPILVFRLVRFLLRVTARSLSPFVYYSGIVCRCFSFSLDPASYAGYKNLLVHIVHFVNCPRIVFGFARSLSLFHLFLPLFFLYCPGIICRPFHCAFLSHHWDNCPRPFLSILSICLICLIHEQLFFGPFLVILD